MGLMQIITDFLFPEKCVLCRKVLKKDETDLCRLCRVDSPVCAGENKKYPFLESWTAVWYYEDAVRKSILRFKFYGARWYAGAYGRMLAMALQRKHPEGFDILTWVPTARARKLRRGYDQAELLAKVVGRELGMQPQKLLKKVRNNKPQSNIIGQAQRRANVLGVYRVAEEADLKEKRILLLDDVITTGATAGEAARVLLTQGAGQVHCGAVAVSRRKPER